MEEKMNHVWLAIIAGGNGMRLFLFSNDSCPKQFCQMTRENTFIQDTARRFLDLGIDPKHVVVITTNSIQKELAISQLVERFKILSDNVRMIGPKHGYAGAKIVATEFIQTKDPEAIIISTPSDQYIRDDEDFKKAIKTGIEVAQNGHPAIIGKEITNAEIAKDLGNIIYAKTDETAYSIDDFIEKTTIEVISGIMQKRCSACNTGITIWKHAMLNMPSETSIGTDKLVNEVLIEPKLVVGNFDWRDCGTFKALYNLNLNTQNGSNVMLSNAENIVVDSCTSSLFITTETIEIKAEGVTNIAVIAREIDDHCYLEIADLGATNEVAAAAKVFKVCPEAFQKGFMLGCTNNKFEPCDETKSVCFINTEGLKVTAYDSESGKSGFKIKKCQ